MNTAAPSPLHGPAAGAKPFDLCGPLPSGTTLLEASAGTGKTFAIAALTARYVAEGTPIERLLVVTFTRAATSELRERVRERLVTAAEGLTQPHEHELQHDQVLALLADASPETVAQRRARLARAVAEFDSATIETTHGFCLNVLRGLGVLGDVERGVDLVEETRDLLDQVIDDFYIRKFWDWPDPPAFTRKEALEIAVKVLGNPGARIVPDLPPGDSSPAMRRSFARRMAEEMDRRKRSDRVMTYDDLLTRLCNTLKDGDACQRLRARYDVVLVDEFQDTDPLQWEIVSRAFGAPGVTLVLVGDPRQAIYTFRGADVHAYLDAARSASQTSTLAVNWRSDQGLVAAMGALFGNAELGHPDIRFRAVGASPKHAEGGLSGPSETTPLRFRILDRSNVPATQHGYPSPTSAREQVARDLASEVVALLSCDATVRDDSTGEWKPLGPGHLAVLVHTNRQANLAREALLAADVPAVVGGGSSVFATAPAEDWLRLLQALDQPTSRNRAAAAALTAFVGWQPTDIATASEDAWEGLQGLLHDWAALLRRAGVAALWETMSVACAIPARVLSRTSGERFMTDLRHVGELLHAASVTERLGPVSLTSWLRARRDESAEPASADYSLSRRLESDAEAVQVLTIHRSKGLEFPVALCPYAWDTWSQKSSVPVFHDDGVRTIDVGGNGSPGFREHRDQDETEQLGEDLRLLYVALTRARHLAVMWWVGTAGSRWSAISRLVLGRDPSGAVASQVRVIPPDAGMAAKLAALGAGITATVFEGGGTPRWERPHPPPAELSTAAFTRVLDDSWRRTSYSGITVRAHDVLVGSETDHDVLTDDDDSARVVPSANGDDDDSQTLLLAGLPRGTEAGTLVHSVLETTDFAADDLDSDLLSALDAELARRRLEVADPASLVAGLRAVIYTPVADAIRLRDVARRDRLDELSFELPLVGGDRPRAVLSVMDIAQLLNRHLSQDDPVWSYQERLSDPSLDRTLRGFLTGSLDLVIRLPGDRFLVADYKSNWLGPPGTGTLTTWHYRPTALDAEMSRAHYPLQAILYSVALHRYLRWRVNGYRADLHLAGVRYLFLRGMSSPDGEPAGVWSWNPPGALIEDISDLFDRGSS